jgi:hypothetical protein
MEILQIEYNDITKHVVLLFVMEHTVNKFYKKKKKNHTKTNKKRTIRYLDETITK